MSPRKAVSRCEKVDETVARLTRGVGSLEVDTPDLGGRHAKSTPAHSGLWNQSDQGEAAMTR